MVTLEYSYCGFQNIETPQMDVFQEPIGKADSLQHFSFKNKLLNIHHDTSKTLLWLVFHAMALQHNNSSILLTIIRLKSILPFSFINKFNNIFPCPLPSVGVYIISLETENTKQRKIIRLLVIQQ